MRAKPETCPACGGDEIHVTARIDADFRLHEWGFGDYDRAGRPLDRWTVLGVILIKCRTCLKTWASLEDFSRDLHATNQEMLQDQWYDAQQEDDQ